MRGHEIHQIVVRAKPKENHPDYFDWQTAAVCFFVRTNDEAQAEATARAELRQRRWDFLGYVTNCILIEELVRNAGGEIWTAYQHSLATGLSVTVIPEHFAAGKDGPPLIRPARISESFISEVIEEAGGCRVVEDDSKQEALNADYLLGDFIIELKDLQEDGLEKGTHQEKLAKLFAPYFQNQNEALIDPSLLTKTDFRTYMDILGGPIQNHVKKAAKQVKATRVLLGRPELRGGLILLNTGFKSYPHELFAEQVERYARKNSSQFEVVISISIWMETNGFDSYVFSKFSPVKSEIREVAAFYKAFDERFNAMMTDLMRGMLPAEAERTVPRSPIAFSNEGIDFSWQPPRISLPWGDED